MSAVTPESAYDYARQDQGHVPEVLPGLPLLPASAPAGYSNLQPDIVHTYTRLCSSVRRRSYLNDLLFDAKATQASRFSETNINEGYKQEKSNASSSQ